MEIILYVPILLRPQKIMAKSGIYVPILLRPQKIMAKSGIDERKIYNTGFPYLDIIFNFNKKKIEEFDEKNRQRK